jgi:hypothetical protein
VMERAESSPPPAKNASSGGSPIAGWNPKR